MQALIDFIIRNLLAVWPIVRVNEWDVAMIVRGGRIHRTIGPGLHWRWIFLEEKVRYPATEVVLSLPTCSVTTRDGRSLAIDANFGYRLRDIGASWRTLWNLEKSLIAAAAGIVASQLAQCEWVDLTRREECEQMVLDALNAFAIVRGMEIQRFHLVACVEAKQHRHFVDGSLAQ